MPDAARLTTHPAPGGEPQPIAFHEGTLWVGCRETASLYPIETGSWSVGDAVRLPGTPFGLASHGGALRVVVSLGDDDDRYLLRYEPGKPLDEGDRVACPELSGSYLTSDGASLYLAQQGLRKLVTVGADGLAIAEAPLPTRCAGIAFDAIAFHFISADDEFDVLELATLDLAVPGARPATIVPLDPAARGLAFDGEMWWTCLRDRNEIASFRTVA